MISREELYELVWSKPMTKVAEQFGVSGSYMARICSILRVPKPERGYWAKLAVGKAPAPEPLPEARPGDQLFWVQDSELPPAPKPQYTPKRSQAARARAPRAGTHYLVHGAKGHFESGRPVEDGLYLKPYKKLLIDVTASKAYLDKALNFASDLFNALESAGHRVVLAGSNDKHRRIQIDEREERSKRPEYRYGRFWSPYRPTIVYVGTVAIGLAIVEMSEVVLLRYVHGKYIRDADYTPPKASHLHTDYTWTTTKDLPSGRLRLVAYSPYGRVSWSRDWQETKKTSLAEALKGIVKAIETSAPELVLKLEEADRLGEIAHQKYLAEEEKRRKEEDRQRIERSVKDSQEHLGQIIKK